MAKIRNFIYCLNVDVVDGRTDIAGVFNVMTPEYIPGLFSFSVSFALVDISEGNHEISFIFRNPNSEEVAKIEKAVITYEKDDESNLPDEQMGMNIAAGMQNVNFTMNGIYSMEIIVDNASAGIFDIYVKGKNCQ